VAEPGPADGQSFHIGIRPGAGLMHLQTPRNP